MKKLISKLTPIQWVAVSLMLVGMMIMIPKANGMLNFYKEVEYAAEHNFASGNVSPDLLRPWMSLRYIAVAYAVPQLYLYDAAGIKPRPETSMLALNRLNQQMGHGKTDNQPELMGTIKDAIVAYRANPVATGLLEQKVEEWMTVQYIANSTGIPVDTILQALSLPLDGNAHKPLGFLSDEVDYPGGKKMLIATIQEIVEAQGPKPVMP
jgi:hypothetical protein